MVLLFWPIVLPIAAQVAQTIVSGINNRKMRKYNSPKEQLSRLNAAGLPYSAFSAGQAGNQTQLPDVSGIGNAGNTLAGYMGSRNDQVDYRVKKNLADISDVDTFEELRKVYADQTGEVLSKREMKHRFDAAQLQFDSFINANENVLKQWDQAIRLGRYEDGTYKKQLDEEYERLWRSNDLLEQAFKNTENANAAKNDMIERMKKGGLNIFESLFMLFIQSVSGGIQGNNFKVGM